MGEPLAKFNSISLGEIAGKARIFGDDDKLGIQSVMSRAFGPIEPVQAGIVVMYNPGTHSAKVLMLDAGSVWACIFTDEPLSYSYGYSLTSPPREGEMVLVQQLTRGVSFGLIIGRLPYNLGYWASGDMHKDPDYYHRRLYTQDEVDRRTWDLKVTSMIRPLQEIRDSSTQIATHFRPTDVFPGEFAHVNQHNCGIKGGMFSATLLGGGASLRMSALSNLARLSCETYQRISLLGRTQEIHNGRYLSSERDVAMYQEERLGGKKQEDLVFTEDSRSNVGGENQTMRPRMKELSGFFGHIYSRFAMRPDPNETGVRVQGKSKPVDEGVSRETVDPSGQYRLSSAGMIAIERTGRIPVPVRVAYPTDKGHDIQKDPESLKPFSHNTSDPGYRQLELFDRQAYDLKNQYARLEGLGDEGNADYYVPQEEDLKPLEDTYDKEFTKSGTVSLKEFDKRRAGVYIGEDGSVIIRDAWGSEVVMLGGNITLACAGSVQILPGRTALTIAGDDIVQKAQNSVDIHASEHDVRLSAARNMEIVGGGDGESYSGGVVIESRGKGVAPALGEGGGEGTLLSGIALKANGQAVTLDGEQLNLRSRARTRIISGGGDISGEIGIAAKTLRSVAKNTIIAGCEPDDDDDMSKTVSRIAGGLEKNASWTEDGGKFGGFDTEKLSALLVTDKTVMAVGQSIGLFSSKSIAATRGSKYPVPMMWVDVEDIYETVRPYISKALSDYGNEKDVSAGFDHEQLEKIAFSFRTPEECGTTSSWMIGAESGEPFKMYEPAWVQIRKKYETLRGVQDRLYREDAKWPNGRPWPGEEREETAKYAELKDREPKNISKDGMNVSREKVEGESEIVLQPLSKAYRVRA